MFFFTILDIMPLDGISLEAIKMVIALLDFWLLQP